MRSESLSKRFREVTLDGKLIAFTNIKEQLNDLRIAQVNHKVQSLNTLSELTFHLNYYISGVLEVFEGRDLTIRDKYSFDMAPLETQEDWDQLEAEFLSNSEKFAAHISSMTDAKLDSHFVKEDYGSYERNIEAMIEHCYYHFGQIVIIKKMVMENIK